MFGAQTPGGFNFGSTQQPPAAQTGFQLPTFGSNPQTTATTNLFAPLGGQTAAAAPTFANLTTQSASGTPGVTGLGGTDTNAGGSLSGSGSSSTDNRITKPTETQLPPEMLALVEEFKRKMKENKDFSDAISAANFQSIGKLGGDITSLSNEAARVSRKLHKTATLSSSLKQDARQDLRNGEMIQRLSESPIGVQIESTAPLMYLHQMAEKYEQQLQRFSDEITSLERLLVAGQRRQTLTPQDILTHLKRFAEAFKHIASKLYAVHEAINEQKELHLRHRRSVYGDSRNPFADPSEQHLTGRSISSSSTEQRRFEGPPPFNSQSTTAILALANAMAKNQSVTGVQFGAVTQPAAPFGGPTNLFVGNVTTSQPPLFGSSTTQSLFKPFSTAAPTGATTPFSNLSGGSSLFNTTSTTASAPAKFSSSFNTASSGTIFGGTAARPLGMSDSQGIIDLSNYDSDEDVPIVPLAERLKIKLNVPSPTVLPSALVEDLSTDEDTFQRKPSAIDLDLLEIPECSDTDIASDSSSSQSSQLKPSTSNEPLEKPSGSTKNKERKRRSPEEIAAEKLAKLHKKEAMAEAKLLKQREKEMGNRAKNDEKEKQRAVLPKESSKYVTVVLDPAVLQFPETTKVLSTLEAQQYQYSVESLPEPKVILWRRRLVGLEFSQDRDENGAASRIEDEIVRLVELATFVDLVKSHSSVKSSQDGQTTLDSLANSLGQIFGTDKRISFVVIGMETYFRHLNTLENRKHREAVVNTVGSPPKPTRTAAIPKGIRNVQTLITRVELELFTINLQMRYNLSVFYVESTDDFSDLIGRFTKAVCEAPYKQLKRGISGVPGGDFADLFCQADEGKGSKVDKDGRGSSEVWHKMLCQYPWVSAEMASAIVQVYGSPKQLLDAYATTSSVAEAEVLLRDIMIRRGAGLVSTQRRVGPEASRKVYAALTAIDGEFVAGKKD